MIHLGHTLGLDVVAEGVESPEQRDELWALGCRRAQGYWFARPMPATTLLHNLLYGELPTPASTSGTSAGPETARLPQFRN